MTTLYKIRQLKNLVRLRLLQRDKSAKQLAYANIELNRTNENKLVAEARYQLILEMQRKARQTGLTINPLYYSHQFEAADVAKSVMDYSFVKWQHATNHKINIMKDFSLHHNQLDIARDAVNSAIIEDLKLQEKYILDDCYDQQSKNKQRTGLSK